MSETKRLALYVELDRRLAEIQPDDYVVPSIVGIPNGSKELGPATDEMKKLWTLFCHLESEARLGLPELLRRATHTAISFEMGKHFNYWGARTGINSLWQVYAAMSN